MPSRMDEIMDAAERRIRDGGYNGFSFREVAADVGIKSASVHYHFQTKADLAVAVARRYADRLCAAAEETPDADPRAAWRAVFRRALHEDGRMCLCGVLGSEAGALPPAVLAEVRRFLERAAEGLSPGADATGEGLRMLATLEGAMLLARAMGDPAAFDEATAHLT